MNDVLREQLALLPGYLTAHLQLTLFALLIGIAVSLPLGILASRVKWIEQPLLAVASIIQTIPSLALLAVMVPLLAILDVQSIGYLPAFIGLTLYSLLPILRNTVTGIGGVDPSLIEAARGVGMTPSQRLRRVEIPLAMPVIVAGIRTSTVWIVGIATLSTPVGATSLGNYIFSGLQTRNYTAVLVGCVAAAILALVLDGIVRAIELGVGRRKRALTAAGLTLLGLLFLYTVGSAARPLWSTDRPSIVLGSKTFTEQYILSELMKLQIEERTGLNTTVRQSLGSTVAFDALVSGDIDAYVDYSGTIWATLMHREDTPGRQKVLDEVRSWLDREHHVELAAVLGFENTYAFAMRRQEAERLNIRTISDLVFHAPGLSLGADYEFMSRPEWKAIQDAYGLEFARERSMDSSLMYQAVAQGDVDVISAFSTDGRIEAFDLVVLEDDRGAIPPYDAIILVRQALSEEYPAAVEALRALQGTVSADSMRRMNYAVDVGGDSPSAVAREFLENQLPAVPPQ
jgi:osmoprotectant transport system permease protein